MNQYIIECKDWKLMESQPEVLCQQFSSLLNIDAIYFAPVLFADYSCLTQYVEEEIDLVISSQERAGGAIFNIDRFIEFWGWKNVLGEKAYNLSGGWRKLLGLSLFLNRKSPGVIIIDFTSHLSDESIAMVLDRMGRLGILYAGFCEYDSEILISQMTAYERLLQSGIRLVPSG